MAGNFTMYDEISATNNGSFVTICLSLPPKINSDGIWGSLLSPSDKARSSPLPLLELQMLMIFCVTIFLHLFLKHFGLPVFVSQIIAGLFLGPSWKGTSKTLNNFKEDLFYIGSQDILGMISVFGYTLFVFLIGVKMDLGVINRRGKKHLIIGILSIFVPALLGFMAAFACSRFGKDDEDTSNILFVAGTQSLTSFAVVACLLDHLQILNSELGRLGLSCALAADLMGLSVTIVAGLVDIAWNRSVLNALMNFGTTIGFVIVVAFIFRPAMLWIVKRTPNGRPVQDVYICVIILLVLVSGVATEILKQSMFFGPFILGLAVPEGPPLGASLVNKLDSMVTSIFLPLFVTVSAVKADLSFINTSSTLLVNYIIVILSTCVGKMAVCFGSSLHFNMPFYDALALGLIMSSRGIVELAVYSFFYDSKLLSDQAFAVLIVDILLVSISMPILVKHFYDPSRKYVGYQKRNILNLKPNAELRILGCLHTQNDVPALIYLLDALCPGEESPVSLYALHLIELVGRATPVFVSHQLHGQKDSSERALSSNIIQKLHKYERNNRGAVSVEVFTAIAPTKLMHEDIFTLALDKLTSIIILPFHRKWTREGYMESEDNAIRALNCTVLERAPCSVGILVDRGHFTNPHSFGHSNSPLFQVAVVFIGGQDDREALSFARRMTKDLSSVLLTVIRLVAEDESISHWEKILDSELLNDVKHSFVGGEPFRYIETTADEGSQTATLVRSITDEYDLVIVGRRQGIESPQTSGLMEWNEFPELGIVGDMLASIDFNRKASVFVIQQQQQLT